VENGGELGASSKALVLCLAQGDQFSHGGQMKVEMGMREREGRETKLFYGYGYTQYWAAL